jgi:hypothetical protein
VRRARSFLVNRQGLALGMRQSGAAVGDVELPPWADGPDDFLRRHRAALEGAYVSANLHHWIDLIFGRARRDSAPHAACSTCGSEPPGLWLQTSTEDSRRTQCACLRDPAPCAAVGQPCASHASLLV